MTKRYHKFEASAWFLTKVVLYLSLLATFIYILGFDNPGLTQVSRTLGIVCVTCAVLEFMFVKTYGGYDVGRRKSKPILFSIFLATVLTDIIAYLQVMVMRVNLITVKHFALRRLDLLLYVIIVQFIIIAVFTYAGNGIFFKVHEPENCIIITDTQTHLNEVVKAVSKYKKQYAITGAVHYKNPNLKELIKESDALFISEVPAGERAAILHYAYKCQKNVYMTPEIEDIMEMNSTDYQIDDAVMINYLGRTFTFEQRIVKRVFDIVISVITLILTSPILLVAIILIKAEDGGSIIYKQARATINGRIFNVYKLRTMKENDNSHSATINDDRITKIGKFLRRTRIDEIPQVY
ncbi:MAG: sugar transferase, partial [Lachnospiraceae bacterium]|nr:sugar transferase [Lachnospiraceae bacterium]